MGFSPQQINQMSVWQYMAALDGFNAANDPEADKRLTQAEEDALWDWIKG
jgi:hypothetical protein